MRKTDYSDLDLNIGRARIGLSLVALASMYVDPTVTGPFSIGPQMLAFMVCHLVYSISVYIAVKSGAPYGRLPALSTGLDIIFATVVAFLTEGPTSPAYAFFAFAIIGAGCRFDLRTTTAVTLCSVALYLLTILIVRGAGKNPYL